MVAVDAYVPLKVKSQIGGHEGDVLIDGLWMLLGSLCAAGGLMLALIPLLVNCFSAASAKSSILVYVASAIGAKHSWFLSLGAFARSKQIG